MVSSIYLIRKYGPESIFNLRRYRLRKKEAIVIPCSAADYIGIWKILRNQYKKNGIKDWKIVACLFNIETEEIIASFWEIEMPQTSKNRRVYMIKLDNRLQVVKIYAQSFKVRFCRVLPQGQLSEEIYNRLQQWGKQTYRHEKAKDQNQSKSSGIVNDSKSQRTYQRKISIQKLEISFDDNNHILYIGRGTTQCRTKKHQIIPVTGILSNLRGKPIKINIAYCKQCCRYFISTDEFRHYQDLYGALLGNVRLENYYAENQSNIGPYGNLACESVLKLFGYSVSQSEDLSDYERHLILSNLMNRKIIEKTHILEYLHFFINTSVGRRNMSLAREKWEDDMDWVRDYEIDTQKKYLIQKFSYR